MRTAIRSAAIMTVGLATMLTLLAPASASPTSSPTVQASGDFSVTILSPIEAEQLPGQRCNLTVSGELTFTGTIDGTARGTTTAIVLAPCTEALSNPPRTFRDVFRFDGEFIGTVDETASTGSLTYFGVTAPGGDIRAAIHLKGPEARASLRADATVLVGGSYSGIAQAR